MSQIVILDKFADQSVSFTEVAEHFGLKNIVHDWCSGDDLPDDSLILVRGTEPVDGGICWKEVELRVLRKKISPDLKRDIKTALSNGVFARQREFSLQAVLLALKIERCSGSVRMIAHEVLLECGCEQVSRAYDLNRKWYKLSAPRVQADI